MKNEVIDTAHAFYDAEIGLRDIAWMKAQVARWIGVVIDQHGNVRVCCPRMKLRPYRMYLRLRDRRLREIGLERTRQPQNQP